MSTAKDWKNKGNSFVQEQKYEDAFNCYSKAIELDPNDPILYSNRSLMLSNLNLYEQAIEDAKKAIQLNPNYAKAYLRLGKAYEGKNDFQKAYEAYSQGLEKDPNNAQINEALKKLSQYEEPEYNEPHNEIPKNEEHNFEMNKHIKKEKSEIGNLIEKYALKKRVELVFVRHVTDYRFEGIIEEISGGFIYFIRDDKYNGKQEQHLININNIIDIRLLDN